MLARPRACVREYRVVVAHDPIDCGARFMRLGLGGCILIQGLAFFQEADNLEKLGHHLVRIVHFAATAAHVPGPATGRGCHRGNGEIGVPISRVSPTRVGARLGAVLVRTVGHGTGGRCAAQVRTLCRSRSMAPSARRTAHSAQRTAHGAWRTAHGWGPCSCEWLGTAPGGDAPHKCARSALRALLPGTSCCGFHTAHMLVPHRPVADDGPPLRPQVPATKSSCLSERGVWILFTLVCQRGVWYSTTSYHVVH